MSLIKVPQMDMIMSASNSFDELVRISGLDPKSDFQYADLTEVDFGDADLRIFRFFGSDLSGSDLSRSKITRETIEGALIGSATLPETNYLDYAIKTEFGLPRSWSTSDSKVRQIVHNGFRDFMDSNSQQNLNRINLFWGNDTSIFDIEANFRTYSFEFLISADVDPQNIRLADQLGSLFGPFLIAWREGRLSARWAYYL